nr:putative ribonuclease H-like domain-containing protein [Tanacetum cinerariifolium]
MDIEIKQDDLNQKFLTSLPPEWLMHTIVQRNRSDLDTMSLDDLYNHLKDITQIDEDDKEEMDIKWNMALLSIKAERFWKKIGKKISIQGTDVAGFDKSKAPKDLMAIDGVGWDWSFMANEKENHALVANEEAPTEFALMAKTSAECEDLSWTGLPEFADDTITNNNRPLPAIKSTSDDLQNRNPCVTETGASPSNIYMTGNISYLSDYEPFDGGYVSFSQGGFKIIGKGTIKNGKLKLENVYFVKDLKYNLFSASQICDNKNNVLFPDSECIVLGRDIKLLDDANILPRIP